MKGPDSKMRDEGAQSVFQLSTLHNHIDHAMLQQKFRPLKLIRQLLLDRLLDYAGAGKTDQRFRFGQDHIAQHRNAGGHAPKRGIG